MPEIIDKFEFEELKKHILKKYKDDSDILKMIEQIKTGIVWEKNDEKINGNVFEEVTEKRIEGNKEKENLIIEGENLEVLEFLMKNYKGEIDLIYIDPPYNTGNSKLGYNDSRKSRADAYSHSAWLSFMKKRLVKARELKNGELKAENISEEDYYIDALETKISRKRLRTEFLLESKNFDAGHAIASYSEFQQDILEKIERELLSVKFAAFELNKKGIEKKTDEAMLEVASVKKEMMLLLNKIKNKTYSF